MVIHTKQKAKLHVRALKKATIKGNKTYTISRNPKIKSDAGVAYAATKPAAGVMSKGAELFRRGV